MGVMSKPGVSTVVTNAVINAGLRLGRMASG